MDKRVSENAVGLFEAKTHLSELVDRIEKGETIKSMIERGRK